MHSTRWTAAPCDKVVEASFFSEEWFGKGRLE